MPLAPFAPHGPPTGVRTCSFMPVNARPRSALLGAAIRARGPFARKSRGGLSSGRQQAACSRGRPLWGCGAGLLFPVIDAGYVKSLPLIVICAFGPVNSTAGGIAVHRPPPCSGRIAPPLPINGAWCRQSRLPPPAQKERSPQRALQANNVYINKGGRLSLYPPKIKETFALYYNFITKKPPRRLRRGTPGPAPRSSPPRRAPRTRCTPSAPSGSRAV